MFIWRFFVRNGIVHRNMPDTIVLRHRHKSHAQEYDPFLRIRWFLRIIRIYRVYLASSVS